MSRFGRSSDGRLYARDGRLCLGCCGPGGDCVEGRPPAGGPFYSEAIRLPLLPDGSDTIDSLPQQWLYNWGRQYSIRVDGSFQSSGVSTTTTRITGSEFLREDIVREESNEYEITTPGFVAIGADSNYPRSLFGTGDNSIGANIVCALDAGEVSWMERLTITGLARGKVTPSSDPFTTTYDTNDVDSDTQALFREPSDTNMTVGVLGASADAGPPFPPNALYGIQERPLTSQGPQFAPEPGSAMFQLSRLAEIGASVLVYNLFPGTTISSSVNRYLFEFRDRDTGNGFDDASWEYGGFRPGSTINTGGPWQGGTSAFQPLDQTQSYINFGQPISLNPPIFSGTSERTRTLSGTSTSTIERELRPGGERWTMTGSSESTYSESASGVLEWGVQDSFGPGTKTNIASASASATFVFDVTYGPDAQPSGPAGGGGRFEFFP